MQLEVSQLVGRLARDVELVLFRVVQESLTNIRRHSGRPRAKLRLNRNSHLTLEISDLGRAFSGTKQTGKKEARFEVGIGIPNTQERVKLIGGRLDIDSSDYGTTVRVTIPLGKNSREKLRILVADDHELVRRGALGVLHSRRGRRVVGQAANGREAVEKTVRLKPDVAIMDISMPELDGVEVVHQIREAVPGTKVLVLTSAHWMPGLTVTC